MRQAKIDISTGVGFFDHMLDLFAKHGLYDLKVKCIGDTHVDAHHTVEDVGIALGDAFLKAMGDKRGIKRYGHMVLPMDEARIEAVLDISARPVFVFEASLPAGAMIGEYDCQLTEEFFRAFSTAAGINLHIVQHAGVNLHHIVEGMFKAVARALRIALETDARAANDIPSTKGVI